MKHKHAEFIIAWANGAEIEVKVNGEWDSVKRPTWFEDAEYRIKPESKPDVAYEVSIMLKSNNEFGCGHPDYPSLRLTFCAETGELKSAKVLK